MEADREVLDSWKIYSKNHQFEYFDESKEKNWSGPFFFVQGADIQFGLISKVIEKQEKINWEAEKKLAEAIVKKVNDMSPKPRFFIICGDLCDAFPVTDQKMREAQMADFKRIFGKVDKEIPLICVCGNHDVGNTPTHEAVKLYRTAFGDDYFSFYCGGILFLVINSQYFYDPSQVQDLAGEHIKWIDNKLEEAKKNGVKDSWWSETVGEDKETKKDEEVKELESLKKIFSTPSPPGKQISVGKMSSSVFSNVNGHKTSHSEIKEQISKNGKLLAKVSGKADFRQEKDGEPQSKSKVDVDIPSKGIHRTILKDGGNVEVVDGQDFSNNGQRRSSIDNGINKISSYAGLDYTPLDMAEYIFWTGDEKGVIMAIQEFLEEGIMSRDEAINCLQSIKTNLEYMEKHYHGLQKTENRLNNGRSHIHDRLTELEKPSSLDYDSLQENERMTNDIYDDPVSKYETSMMKPDAYDRRPKIQLGGYESPLRMKSFGQGTFTDRAKRYREDVKGNGVTLTEDDFEELLERLRVADFLYSEYSLEEVIYQLAKVVFSQSLARGSSDAQVALQRFVSFLEKEARLGQISRGLEKKIIDLLIAALSDTLAEHPQLLSAVKENLNDIEVPNLSSSMIMKNQLEKNSKESSFAGNLGSKTTSKASPSLQNKAATSKN